MNQFVPYCFALRSQIHLFHFQTTSFAEHKALDGFYNDIVELIDSLVETYQGIYGRVKVDPKTTENIENYKDNKQVVKTISAYVKECKKMKKSTKEDDSDLQNILDEMIALGNKTLYLLTLK